MHLPFYLSLYQLAGRCLDDSNFGLLYKHLHFVGFRYIFTPCAIFSWCMDIFLFLYVYLGRTCLEVSTGQHLL